MKQTFTDHKPTRLLRKHATSAYSIVSGPENPSTLGCVFYEMEGGGVIARFVPTRLHEGHGHMMHGGFISAALDEAMGRALNNSPLEIRSPFVTGEMTVRFLQPIAVDQTVYVLGRFTGKAERRAYTEGQMFDEKGLLLATSTGVYVMVNRAGDDEIYEGYHGLDTLPLGPQDPTVL